MSSPLLKPRWLVGHVLVAGLTMAFTFLGFWQLDRHFQQREDNRVVEARIAAEPIPFGGLTDPDAAELGRVVAIGRYDYGAQLELRPRARNGQVGYDQIVPLDIGTELILVNRGFIADAVGVARLRPGADREVEVTGTVRLSQGVSRFGPQNPDGGVLETIARLDLDRLDSQFDGRLAPIYLDLISEQPDAGGLATVLPAPPEPTNRPNFLYALQWWAFGAISSVGWLLFLRTQFGGR
jgi:cytochrome oxidase assembly protein ShyY1